VFVITSDIVIPLIYASIVASALCIAGNDLLEKAL
jgi:hypothetical protein